LQLLKIPTYIAMHIRFYYVLSIFISTFRFSSFDCDINCGHLCHLSADIVNYNLGSGCSYLLLLHFTINQIS